MWDLKCIAAAACFTLSNLLYTIYGVLQMRAISHDDGTSTDSLHNFTNWKELDPIYIQKKWFDSADTRPLMTWAGLFGCMAWFWFIVPIIQAAWILSRGGKRMVGTHMLLGSLAVFGGLIELLARLLMVGMTNAAMWLSKDFNLSNWTSETSNDGTGWRVLEMIHTVTHGMILWVDAFETLIMFGIVTAIYYSVSSEPSPRSSGTVEDESAGLGSDSMDRIGVELDTISNPDSTPPSKAFNDLSSKVAIHTTFNKCFINYGLFLGAVSIIDFIMDVLRFVNWKVFGSLSMALNVIIGVILLPVWLLIFAKQLPVATEKFENMQQWEEEDEKRSLVRGTAV
ncbi:hypothetical protein ACHAXN_012725 [Cyclotella atomus]